MAHRWTWFSGPFLYMYIHLSIQAMQNYTNIILSYNRSVLFMKQKDLHIIYIIQPSVTKFPKTMVGSEGAHCYRPEGRLIPVITAERFATPSETRTPRILCFVLKLLMSAIHVLDIKAYFEEYKFYWLHIFIRWFILWIPPLFTKYPFKRHIFFFLKWQWRGKC